MYKSETEVCADVVRLDIDHVYARSRLGDQNTIAQLLNKKLTRVENIIADHDGNCVKQVLRVLCHFYLPPCGNATHPTPPSSICQRECQMVQEKCEKTWEAVLLAFAGVTPVINCNDTSSLLFPVPHCCTGAGLEKGGCEDGEVRLQAGLAPSNGYVELCLDRTWVGICSDGLDVSHARAVCNQLNFDPQGRCLYLCPLPFLKLVISLVH